MPAYAGPVAKSHGRLYGGGILGLVGGIIAIVAGWLPWIGSGGFTANGWDGFSSASNIGERFAQVADGKIAFTALSITIAAGLTILFALLMLLSRKKGLGVLVLVLSLVTLAMAVLTMVAFYTTDVGSLGVSVQYGLYIMAAFALISCIGGIVALAD